MNNKSYFWPCLLITLEVAVVFALVFTLGLMWHEMFAIGKWLIAIAVGGAVFCVLHSVWHDVRSFFDDH